MRASTRVHVALRNIGDSQDGGKFFEGELKESIFWLASELAGISMATRIVIGIGRNKLDAGRGIDVKNSGQSVVTSDMKSMLDQLMSDSEDDDSLRVPPSSVALAKIDGDDYEGPNQ